MFLNEMEYEEIKKKFIVDVESIVVYTVCILWTHIENYNKFLFLIFR